MRIGVIGNCQAPAFGDCVSRMTGAEVERIQHHASLPLDASALASCDFVFAQPHYRGKIEGRVIYFPRVTFSGYCPDMIYLGVEGGRVRSPLGEANSAIVARAWKDGLSVRQTTELFHSKTFNDLGFFSFFDAARRRLVQEGEEIGVPMADLFDEFQERGCFMHTFNHPHGFVIARVAETMLTIAGIPFTSLGTPPDPLAELPIWPVYPEIAERFGGEGGYQFVTAVRTGRRTLDLESFIAESFAMYDAQPRERFNSPRIEEPPYRRLAAGAAGDHPYRGLPGHQFWKRAMDGEVDPVVRGAFTISKTDKVATAGSCFAQHIARTLAARGFRYFVAESEPAEGGANYGVFSARYGNLYTARQLVQLFDRAHGKFEPLEAPWTRGAAIVDPFRPEIEPDGFLSLEALVASRAAHFEAVRRMFVDLDVFVFTLGLTEAWRSREDGAVFPLAPGVSGGIFDPARHEFHNFTVGEVIADLEAFLARLHAVNQRARVILTVSPVPLAATYEPRHVLVSTTLSKSVLRVAADDIAARFPQAAYFPSYEIITGAFSRGAYFEDDLRNVRPAGVEHVMRLFLRHYGASDDVDAAVSEAMEIVCEEEQLAAL